jgi:hypothetical protein
VRSKFQIALFAAAATVSAANADTNFVGRWSQAASEPRCSVVLAFQLEADGTARSDWAAFPADTAVSNFRSVIGHRAGHWTSSGDTLHLVILDVLSDPAVLKSLGRSAPLTTEVHVDGSLAGDGRLNTLITDSRDRSIDGAPYEIHCTYVRSP